MRVRISGSGALSNRSWSSALIASIDSPCCAALMPCGLSMYDTGSPNELIFTPWNLLGRMPADHWRAAIGCMLPPRPVETMTTKPGRFSASDPRP